MAQVNDVRVPDSIEPIIGWRAWRIEWVGDELRLMSVTGSVLWPRGWFVATCVRHERSDKHQRNIPVETCSCGIYAARDRSHLLRMGYNHYVDLDDPTILGQVALAGKVIVGTKGYRASHARPVCLYVPHSKWRLAKPLYDVYEVPIDRANPFR
jgi:hypothetical protein